MKIILKTLWAILPFFFLVAPENADGQIPDTLLHNIPAPLDGVGNDGQLGTSVAVDGSYTVAGAPEETTVSGNKGVVKVFNSITGAQLLTLPNPSSASGFGSVVALSGTRVVVGKYIYDLTGTTPTVPALTLMPPQGGTLGNSIAIEGVKVVVSGSFHQAYVYDLSSATAATPVFTLQCTPWTSPNTGMFVAISNSRVAVSNYPTLKVFDLASASPTVAVATFDLPRIRTDGNLHPVAISGNRVALVKSIVSTEVFDLTSSTPAVAVAAFPQGGPVAIVGTRVLLGNSEGYSFTTTALYDLATATPTIPVATFTSPISSSTSPYGQHFGKTVAMSGTRAVIADPLTSTATGGLGCVYCYDVASAAPNLPTQMVNIPGPSSGDRFGSAVAVSNSRMVVGVPYSGPNEPYGPSGRAYVYDLSSQVPVPVYSLSNPTLNPSPFRVDLFGSSVAVSASHAVVGAARAKIGSVSCGIVYVYDLASGNPSTPVLTLNNPTPAEDDYFGCSVAVSGSWIVVGAFADETWGASHPGSAYVYNLASATPAIPVYSLVNPHPGSYYGGFGTSVAISGTRVVVGAPSDDAGGVYAGSAYVYELGGATPTTPVLSLTNPVYVEGDTFGHRVAISDGKVAVASLLNTTLQSSLGSVFIYDLASATPSTSISTIHNPLPSTGEYFGFSVSLSGNKMVVGAALSDYVNGDVGRAYVFDLASPTPTVPVKTLSNPTPSPYDGYGGAVAIDGNVVAVGTPNEGSVLPGKGAVYVYGPTATATAAPTLMSPTANTFHSGLINVSFTLPEQPLAGSVKLTFHDGMTARAITLAASQETPVLHTFSLSPANPTAAPEVASGPQIPDGSYSVYISYQDAAGNPVASSTPSTNIVIDTSAPAINPPAGGYSPVTFVAPFSLPNFATQAVVSDLAGVASIIQSPASGTILGAGSTVVTLTATDTLGHVGSASFTVTGIAPPTLVAPTTNALTGGPVSISFSLPVTAANGSVKLTFSNGVAPVVYTLAASQQTAGAHSFSFAPSNPTGSAEIASGPALLDGTYTVSISYQSATSGGPIASSAHATNVVLDTVSPSINAPVGGFTPLVMVAPYSLPNYATQAVVADGSGVPTVTQTPVPGTLLASGNTTVALTATDALGHTASLSFTATGLSRTADTDGDGLNDASELEMTTLGFNWQVAQPAMVNTYKSAANGAGYFTPSQVQALHVGTPLIARNTATGQFKLTIGVKKSTDLLNFTDFPMTSPQTLINGAGKIEFTFSGQGNAAFYRLQVQP